MKLSAPRMITFVIGVALGAIALLLKLLPTLGASNDVVIVLALLGVVVLAAGNVIKGL